MDALRPTPGTSNHSLEVCSEVSGLGLSGLALSLELSSRPRRMKSAVPAKIRNSTMPERVTGKIASMPFIPSTRSRTSRYSLFQRSRASSNLKLLQDVIELIGGFEKPCEALIPHGRSRVLRQRLTVSDPRSAATYP